MSARLSLSIRFPAAMLLSFSILGLIGCRQQNQELESEATNRAAKTLPVIEGRNAQERRTRSALLGTSISSRGHGMPFTEDFRDDGSWRFQVNMAGPSSTVGRWRVSGERVCVENTSDGGMTRIYPSHVERCRLVVLSQDGQVDQIEDVTQVPTAMAPVQLLPRSQ
jgi:hypothetical protein